MFYEEVFRKLNQKGVRYAVTGGIALVLHGVIRLTADLDVIVDLSRENLRNFLEAIRELGFQPRVPVRWEEILDSEKRKFWIEEKNMVVVSFYHPRNYLYQIDLFIREPVPFEEIEKEINWIKARDLEIPVVSRELLKRLKKLAGRPQDLKDIEALEALNEG